MCEKNTNVILAYPYAKEGEFLLPEDILLTDSEEMGWQGALTTSPYILTRIQINDTNPNYVVKDGALYNRSMDILIKVSPDITKYLMPDSVIMIANCAFWGCNKLRKIVLGPSLREISSQELTLAEQLRDCKKLSSLIVSEFNSNYYSNKHGFVYHNDYDNFIYDRLVYFPPAKRIKKCVIPSGTQSIASDAFSNCSKIESFSFYGNHNIKGIDSFDSTQIENAFKGTFFYNNKDNWKDGILYIDNILIKVSDEYPKQELIIPSGTDVITKDAITCPNIESIVIEDGVRNYSSYAINCPNIKTIKFPKTLSIYHLEGSVEYELRWLISIVHNFKYLEKILIPQGMRNFFLMFCSSSFHSLFVEYDEEGNEHPIKPLSDEEKEFYNKIHCYSGAPNFVQYTLIKLEFQKGEALSRNQIYRKLCELGILDEAYRLGILFDNLMYNLSCCFKRDGITMKSIMHKDNDGKEEVLYYIESH